MDNGGNPVQDEFLRLMRAIYDSLERESELQRLLRRSKEALVSVALRLQVAIRVAQDDEYTLASLQSQAEESKAREIVATKRAEEAIGLINGLTIEVQTLRRKLRMYEAERTVDKGNASSNVLSLQQQQAMSEVVDQEVDTMLAMDLASEIIKQDVITEKVKKNATPFDKWKMKHLLYTPDTPAASLQHDTHVLDMLLEQATLETNKAHSTENLAVRPTRSSLGKMKRFQRRLQSDQEMQTNALHTSIPASKFDFINDDYMINTLQRQFAISAGTAIPKTPPAAAAANSKQSNGNNSYFLGSSPEQVWGANRVHFDTENMGRINYWVRQEKSPPLVSAAYDLNGTVGFSSHASPHSNKHHHHAGVKLQSMTSSSPKIMSNAEYDHKATFEEQHHFAMGLTHAPTVTEANNLEKAHQRSLRNAAVNSAGGNGRGGGSGGGNSLEKVVI